MSSWIEIRKDSHFSLANIPFGIISTVNNPTPRVAVAIGEHVLDLQEFSTHDGFAALPELKDRVQVFSEPSLNGFASLGRPVHRQVRTYLREVLRTDTPYPEVLQNNQKLRDLALIPVTQVETHLPMQIGDYTDFYAGMNHAHNVGVLFRGADNALQPNYTHLPVGYHGRASSVVVSGTPIVRPSGQILLDPKANPKVPVFAASRKLDIELELGAFVCRSNPLGKPINIGEANQYLFGVVLMNDWSARDIQAWEYVPLGPFGAKNFGTTIGAWVVLADALEPFLNNGLPAKNDLLPYLQEEGKNVYDIKLEVDLTSKS
jgi:fumarylacetoacetase